MLGQRIIQFPGADAKKPADALARAEHFRREFKDNELSVAAVAAHAISTNDRATLAASAALARKYGAPIVIHVAETEDEVKTVREQYGMTPVAALESLGGLGPTTIAAHGGWGTDAGIGMPKRTGPGAPLQCPDTVKTRSRKPASRSLRSQTCTTGRPAARSTTTSWPSPMLQGKARRFLTRDWPPWPRPGIKVRASSTCA